MNGRDMEIVIRWETIGLWMNSALDKNIRHKRQKSWQFSRLAQVMGSNSKSNCSRATVGQWQNPLFIWDPHYVRKRLVRFRSMKFSWRTSAPIPTVIFMQFFYFPQGMGLFLHMRPFLSLFVFLLKRSICAEKNIDHVRIYIVPPNL